MEAKDHNYGVVGDEAVEASQSKASQSRRRAPRSGVR